MGPEGPLLDEGRAMIEAVARDWAALPDVEVDLAWDRRLAPDPTLDVRFRYVESAEQERQLLESAADYDAAIVLAPELACALIERTAWVEEAGGRLLCPGSAAVVIGSDKRATEAALCLEGDGDPRVQPICSYEWAQFCQQDPAMRGDWIVKPLDGVGGERVFRVGTVGQACEIVEEDIRDLYLVQPYVPGKAASVAALGGPSPLILPPCSQSIQWRRGQPFYGGGEILSDAAEIAAAQNAMRYVLERFPPFVGYLGIDLILTPEGPRIVEVNPRLTTSYVGIRAAIGESLADLTRRVAAGEVCSSPRVVRQVRYDGRGVVTAAA
jgi:predicted ATP-grasp superfamily ATP-dependent carboligase